MTAFPYPFTLAQPVPGGYAAVTYHSADHKSVVSLTFAELGQAITVADRIDEVGARVLCPAAGQSPAHDADQMAAAAAFDAAADFPEDDSGPGDAEAWRQMQEENQGA